MTRLPIFKIFATAGGAALTGAATWLNAEHVAHAEGWASPLVTAGIIVTLAASLTPPVAERCAKDGQPLKAAVLWLFFLFAVCFSMSASISRAGGHRDAQVAEGESSNLKAEVAREAYDAAKKVVREECVKRGSFCRKAEAALASARAALGIAPSARAADPGALRIAKVMGVSQEVVALYSPLALPFALELGGFAFLACGLAPRRRRKDEPLRDDRKDDDGNMAHSHIEIAKPVAKLIAKPAKPVARPAIAALPAPAKAGTRAYFLARLQAEFPKLAEQVEAGAMSVYAATVMAGLRKPALA